MNIHHHEHAHGHGHHHHGPGHAHGMVDRAIARSREGVRAVSISLAILATAALAQTFISPPRAASPSSRTSSTTTATR
jgi:hypothetical protein